MYTESEGIVLKSYKITNGRRMLVLFTKKYGKIVAGAGINERGRGKTGLAMKPFTYGKYELNKKREYFFVNGATTIRSYYGIGEDIDKFIYASRILEIIDRTVEENQPMPAMLSMVIDYMEALEKRSKKIETLALAMEIKVISQSGYKPDLNVADKCEAEKELYFSIADGRMVLGDEKLTIEEMDPTLILRVNFDTISAIEYFLSNPLWKLERMALGDETLANVRKFIRKYGAYHLDLGELKSEGFQSFNEEE